MKTFSFVLGLLAVGVSAATAVVAMQTDGVGDCNTDGDVTIDEIVVGVSIVMGVMPMEECRAFDRSDDHEITIDELIIGVNNALRGHPATSTPTPTRTGPPPTRTPTFASEMELFDVGANFFSIRKPRGWDIHIAGVCSTLGILIRDPAVPLRQIFYFGLIGPVYLKEQQRQIDWDYIHSGGYNVITWLDAPAVDPLTTENFFIHWPGIAAMKAATDFMPQFPKLTALSVVSAASLSSTIPGDAALLRAVFTEAGTVGQAQLLGTVWVSVPFTGVPGAGTAYGSVILGVTAPKGEFGAVEPMLTASLASLTVTQGYVNWCIAQQQRLWGAVARAGQTLRETSDMIFEGWQNRTSASDIIAEKGSDALRGVDRVYDPGTRQVYEVPVGWYTGYDTHRGQYVMDNLQLLPADSVELWMSAPADGSAIH